MKDVFKMLLFIIISSTVLSILFNYLYTDNDFVLMGAAIPASVISSTLFLILDYFYMKNKTSTKKLFIFRGIFLIVLYIVVVTIMMKGGDVIYHLFPPSYDS